MNSKVKILFSMVMIFVLTIGFCSIVYAHTYKPTGEIVMAASAGSRYVDVCSTCKKNNNSKRASETYNNHRAESLVEDEEEEECDHSGSKTKHTGTCTYYWYTCDNCNATTSSGGYSSHSYPTNYTNYSSTQHRRLCTHGCGTYEYTDHSWCEWQDYTSNAHIRYCTASGCNASQTGAHNTSGGVLPNTIDAKSYSDTKGHALQVNKDNHILTCECGHYTEQASHGEWTKGDYPNPHTCSKCRYKRTSSDGYPYHVMSSKLGKYDSTSECELNGCNATFEFTSYPSFVDSAKDLKDYTAIGSSKEYIPETELKEGKYSLKLNFIPCDVNGTPLSDYNDIIDGFFITIIPFTRQNYNGHWENYSESYEAKNVVEAATQLQIIVYSIFNDGEKIDRDEAKKATEHMLVEMAHEDILTEYFGDWDFSSHKIPTLKIGTPTSINGNYDSKSATFSFEIPNTSGRIIFNSKFFFKGYLNDAAIFSKGGKTDTDQDGPVLGQVYYCYRTTDNQIPNNGYASLYRGASPIIWENKHAVSGTGSQSADMTKIDKTGYRYVGYKIQNGVIGASNYDKNVNTSEKANYNLTFGFNGSQSQGFCTITFFVEPVKLYYGHASTSYQNGLKDIEASANTGVLEFCDPQYFNGDHCEISIKSLNKYWWPGYILNSNSVYAYNGGKVTDYEGKAKYINRVYTDSTTTNLTDRKTVTETVLSSYNSAGTGGTLSDRRGYAQDKQLYFYYTLPEIKVDHINHENGSYMRATDNANLSYTTEILHQFAYIDSLNTDNVGVPHTLRIDDIKRGNTTFAYDATGYDLVQVKIYEVNKNGTETLYGILYNDDDYAPKSKGVKVNYTGVFEKWYSESLSTLVSMTNKNAKETNTNKNWHIVFEYQKMSRVHISFMDMNGNKLFLKDPENIGKYLGELSNKIPTSGTNYTITDLSEYGYNGYKPVIYTYDNNGYVRVPGTTSATIGQLIDIPNEDKDVYIVIFYSNNKTVTVEYRDTKENTLRPSQTLDIPVTGTVINLPDMGDYEIVGYKKDGNFGDENDNITYGDNSTFPITQLTKSDSQIPVQSNGNDQHVVIYYKAKPVIKVEYRDTDENLITVPPDYVSTKTIVIPEGGIIIEVPEVPGYEIKYYKIDENWLGDPNISEDGRTIPTGGITVTPNGNDQHIIIYYEKTKPTINLTIEYRENTPDGRELHEKVTIQVPVGTTDVTPLFIEKYTATKYQISGDTGTAPISTPIIHVIIDEETGDQKLIIIYEKVPTTTLVVEYREENQDGEPGEQLLPPKSIEIPVGYPTQITPENIPGYTPDYYQSGDTLTKHPEVEQIIVVGEPDKPEKIIIVYKKTYPENPGGAITPDDNIENIVLRANNQGSEEYNVEVAIPTSEDLYISGDIYGYRFVTEMDLQNIKAIIPVVIEQDYYRDVDDMTKKGTVQTNRMDIEIDYNYFDIKRAELYDLKAIDVKNDAIKYYNGYNYDTGTSGIYQTGDDKVTLSVNKEIPSLYYRVPNNTVGQNENDRVQIRSTSGYTVRKVGDVYYIKLNDVAYEKPNTAQFTATYRQEAQSILEKVTYIKVQTLGISMSGENDVKILTGAAYNLPQKSTALNPETASEYYIPYADKRVPLYSFNENKDLYVKEEATNGLHLTEVAGNYRLIQSIPQGQNAILGHNPINGTRLADKPININSINVHTPIVNGITLKYGTDSSNIVQLIGTTSTSNGTTTFNGNTVLNLDRTFIITIPNSGNHLENSGYGNNKAYNHTGLTVNGQESDASKGSNIVNGSRINHKSENKLSTAKVVKENGSWKIQTTETEQNTLGPSFAEYKLVRFPFDVYLQPTGDDKSQFTNGNPILLKANEWYNLYNFVTPNITEYTFALPIWVEDAKAYKDKDGIQVLVIAENCPSDYLNTVLNSVDITTVTKGVTTAASNASDKTRYIIRKTYNVYVSGRVYDLQVRDTDDPGYMNKIKTALKVQNLPLAQKGQVTGYNMGLKLGYRFYFDLKTKGISNNSIKITPKIYYVSTNGGTATDEISLFYNSKTSLYNKLTENDLNIRMAISTTHGTAGGNTGFTAETVAARQLNSNRSLTNAVVIGKILGGLNLKVGTEKLPYDCITAETSIMGFGSKSGDFVTSSLASERIRDVRQDGVNDIKNCVGHWYGEYYLPATTVVGKSKTTDKTAIVNPNNQYTTGYLIVTFEEITTGVDESGTGYLSYAKPNSETQWQKENAHTTVKLPNGKQAEIPTSGQAMAIYQVGLRANNDAETEGTH